MPYIKPEDRERYDDLIAQLAELLGEVDREASKGHHNYVMFALAVKLAVCRGVRYATFNDIIGTFDCCKAEFYRRCVAPHEDRAMAKNGDIDGLTEEGM